MCCSSHSGKAAIVDAIFKCYSNYYATDRLLDTINKEVKTHFDDVCLLKGKGNILTEKGNIAYSFEPPSNKILVKDIGFLPPCFALFSINMYFSKDIYNTV